ncbi:hypothetical protein ACFQX6_50920 [Streptosporangium lutulentum]
MRGAKRLLRRRATVQDTTTWRAEIVIWSRGARATGLLRGPSIGRTERPSGLEVRPSKWVRPVWTSDRALQIVLQPTRAELTGVRLDGEKLEVSVFLPGKGTGKGHARLDGHRISADFTPVEGAPPSWCRSPCRPCYRSATEAGSGSSPRAIRPPRSCSARRRRAVRSSVSGRSPCCATGATG